MTKVKVARRAVFARLARHLNKENLMLKKSREDSRWLSDLGDYYIVNATNNTIASAHINLEELAKEEGLLKPFEELED